MYTCVLCFRRRNALQWTTRSRSRWNGVRTRESSSSSSRRAGYERCASGDRNASSRAEMRSRKATGVAGTRTTSILPRGAGGFRPPLSTLAPPFGDLEPEDQQQDGAQVDRQLDQDVAGVGERRDHVFTAGSRQSPRLLKATITTSI